MILGILLNFLSFSEEFSLVVTQNPHDISELKIFWKNNKSIKMSVFTGRSNTNVKLNCQETHLLCREGRKEKCSHIKDKELAFGKT